MVHYWVKNIGSCKEKEKEREDEFIGSLGIHFKYQISFSPKGTISFFHPNVLHLQTWKQDDDRDIQIVHL